MARMIPKVLRDDVESEAERLLYRKFQDELSDAYTVIHQARWIGRRWGKRGQDGEADFVILHPEEGILVLEAKGGEIRLDGEQGTWITKQGKNERILPQSPFTQAADSKYALRDLLLGVRGLKNQLLHFVHGVALPHVQVPSQGLGPDAPRERILDANDLQHVTSWVRTALASVDLPDLDLRPLGKDGVEKIVDTLAVSRVLPVHAPSVAHEVRQKRATLTDEQYDVLRSLATRRRGRVRGGPGTGKTLLATEMARRLAAAGRRVLLVCFNAPLGGHLKETTKDLEGVTACHFHELCRMKAVEAGFGQRLLGRESRTLFEETYPEVLFDAATKLEQPYGAIVVDEAQDFLEGWWAPLEAWLVDGEHGALYLFEDQDQQLKEGGEVEGPDNLEGAQILTRNCRNPDEIHHFLEACLGGDLDLRPSGIHTGVLPRIRWLEKAGQLPRQVSTVVATLMHEHAVEAKDIVVLTPRAPQNSQLGRTDRRGPAPAVWRERTSDDQVLIDTVQRFKGLAATAR